MKNFSEIDKNFKIETKIDKEDIEFINALDERFSLYGIFYENGRYRRMPEAVARTVSEGVYELHANTAGGRLRFKTNSPYVAISVKYENFFVMSHFAMCGSSGFDMYVNNRFFRSFLPPIDTKTGYEGILEIGNTDIKEIMIDFPLYNDVLDLYIGLAENSIIEPSTPYRNEKPVVYYGSSITQGGCASRPGNSYEGFISRALNLDYINLGFSGNARAEDEIADYIASLPMSMFVYDYDFNTPSYEHLVATHEKMFLKIREAHPDISIIILTAPKFDKVGGGMYRRRELIRQTYKNALERGDKNVYFISGEDLLMYCGNDGTVDSTHPTDFGFNSMARVLIDLMKTII